MKATDGQVRSLGTETILSPDLRASSVIAALVVSPTGSVLAANDFMLKLLGWPISELLGTRIHTSLLASPSDWQPWAAVSAGQQASGAQIQLKTRDGRVLLLRGDIRPVAGAAEDRRWLTGLFVDATAAKHLETSLGHASRMEAVASLTTGIAHDFSNLLTVLVGNLYLVSEGVRDRVTLYEKTKLARDAAKRGIDLIRQLLAFARNEWIEAPSLDLRKVLGNLEPLLKRALGMRIVLETRIAPEVSLIDANAGQLESVLVNLVMNARDAIEATGTIRISAANATADDREAAAHGVLSGEYVRISVSDDGAGIPEQLLGRVFEPFFSTKGNGKGTGLGLSMVRLFAIQAGGTVLLKSQPGTGTTVSLLLPRSVKTTTAATAVNTMPLSTLPGGKETILVFAEEEDVRSTVEQILNVLGYRVILGTEWHESLEILKTATVHLALIDVKSVPGAPGLRLLQATTKLRPPVRTVILRDSPSVHYRGVTTLQKPFDLSGLATTVRQSLDGGNHER